MPRAVKDGQLPLFDFRSFGRWGPQPRELSLAQVAQIARTVRRSPEVMVKVSGGAKSLEGALAHFRYIDRRGALDVETDEGQTLRGKDTARELVDSWELESALSRARSPYRGKAGRVPVKLVHNLVFSMPTGTAPDKVKAAVHAFAREQFGSKHRYALVLHTDQDHPHVHLAVKAMGENGRRLTIRKATLRDWRSTFAGQLRAHGVDANATPRAERGQGRSSFKDAIYRAGKRGASTHLFGRARRIEGELRAKTFQPASGKTRLLETRRAAVEGWSATAEALTAAGRGALADEVRRFVAQMPAPQTTDEQLADHLRRMARERQAAKEPPLTR